MQGCMRRSGRLRNHQTNCQGPPYSTRCECTSPSVPVKRHRGEPGHTGHTGGKRHRGEKWGSRDKPRRHGCQVKSSQVKSSRRPRGRRARLRPPCSLTALVEQAPRALVELLVHRCTASWMRTQKASEDSGVTPGSPGASPPQSRHGLSPRRGASHPEGR